MVYEDESTHVRRDRHLRVSFDETLIYLHLLRRKRIEDEVQKYARRMSGSIVRERRTERTRAGRGIVRTGEDTESGYRGT